MKFTTFKYSFHEINKLPPSPGVYHFYDKKNNCLYVGKAKDLKKRVSSYFTNAIKNNMKIQKMVSEIEAIHFVIVNSEYEAFLLENNFIKSHQPKYNFLLRDDKTYPYICITKEAFPRITVSRKINKAIGEYYGPFTNSSLMYEIIQLIHQIYPIRVCRYHLSQENIQKRKFKVCLEYHIDNCKGPCAGLQSEADYLENIQQIKYLLKGNFTPIKKALQEDMFVASKALSFEKAEEYKKKIDAIDQYEAKCLVAHPKIDSLAVFTILDDEQEAFINLFQVQKGMVIFSDTFEVKKKLNETTADILSSVIFNAKKMYSMQVQEILTNIPITLPLEGVKLYVPQIGDKKKLLELGMKNALFFKKEKLEQRMYSKQKPNKTLELLQKDLNIKILPDHIECFDNSHLQGTHTVGVCVCFKNAQPYKKGYQKFHIQTIEGINDVGAMKEVVSRRYRYLLANSIALPKLIMVDGGKGQLNAALEALTDLDILDKVFVISIAKRLEEIYVLHKAEPLGILKKSPSLKLLQRIRDEAHRFAITFHKNMRSKQNLRISLKELKGVGEQTVQKLLIHFKSFKAIRSASLADLSQCINMERAKVIYKFLHPLDKKEGKK